MSGLVEVLDCNWPRCNLPKTGKCFAWCKCRCHQRPKVRRTAGGMTAAIALHRCVDVHPDRHDQGGVGTCAACLSWAAHVAAAVESWLAERLASDEVRDVAANALNEALNVAGWNYGTAETAADEGIPAALTAITAALTQGDRR